MRSIVVIALGVAACSSSSGNGVQPGELGRGKFAYACGPGADAQCNDNADLAIVDPATNLPPIALGSIFSVGYTDKYGGSQHTYIADSSFFAVRDGWLVALQTGEAAIWGESPGSSDYKPKLEDMVHVKVVSVDHLELAQTKPMGGSFKGVVTVPGLTATATLAGAPVTQLFRVVPMTADRKLVAGGLLCSWTSNNPQVATIMTDPTKNIVTVQYAQAGMATLHVTLGALAADVNVTVSP
jgi:hypothetical protein